MPLIFSDVELMTTGVETVPHPLTMAALNVATSVLVVPEITPGAVPLVQLAASVQLPSVKEPPLHV